MSKTVDLQYDSDYSSIEKRIALVTDDIESGVKEIFAAFAQTSNELRNFDPNATSTVEEMKNRNLWRRYGNTNANDVLTQWLRRAIHTL